MRILAFAQDAAEIGERDFAGLERETHFAELVTIVTGGDSELGEIERVIFLHFGGDGARIFHGDLTTNGHQ